MYGASSGRRLFWTSPARESERLLLGQVGHEKHAADDGAAVIPQAVAVDEHRYRSAVARDDLSFKLRKITCEQVLPVHHQELAVILLDEPQRGPADDLLAAGADHAAEGLVDIGHDKLAVHQEKAFVGGLDDAPVLFFRFAAFRFRPEPLEFGRGPGRKNLKNGPGARLLRHRARVHDRQVADDPAVAVQQGCSQIAGGVDGFQARSFQGRGGSHGRGSAPFPIARRRPRRGFRQCRSENPWSGFRRPSRPVRAAGGCPRGIP